MSLSQYHHIIVTFSGSPGARLYHSTASVWLSVDPLSDKYPSVSPYTYCANNPVRLVDPDGRKIDEWNFNIITGERQWVSDKGGKMVDYINVYDGNGYLLGTATMGNNANEKTAVWSAQDLGNVKWRGLYLSDGANDYDFSYTNGSANPQNSSLSTEIPCATYGQDNAWASDISFGTAIESGMIGGAAELSGQGRFLRAVGAGSKWLGVAGGLVSTAASFSYAVENPSIGNYVRTVVQGATVALNFCGPIGTAVSVGVTVLDYYCGDDFYNWLDK